MTPLTHPTFVSSFKKSFEGTKNFVSTLKLNYYTRNLMEISTLSFNWFYSEYWEAFLVISASTVWILVVPYEKSFWVWFIVETRVDAKITFIKYFLNKSPGEEPTRMCYHFKALRLPYLSQTLFVQLKLFSWYYKIYLQTWKIYAYFPSLIFALS